MFPDKRVRAAAAFNVSLALILELKIVIAVGN